MFSGACGSARWASFPLTVAAEMKFYEFIRAYGKEKISLRTGAIENSILRFNNLSADNNPQTITATAGHTIVFHHQQCGRTTRLLFPLSMGQLCDAMQLTPHSSVNKSEAELSYGVRLIK